MRWLPLTIGGRKIEVHLVKRTHKKLEDCDGIYHPTEGRIYIDIALDASSREDTLIHELDHVVNDVSGATNAMAEANKRLSLRRLNAVEEQMVRCRTPLWHRLLKDLGFRFPKGPYE